MTFPKCALVAASVFALLLALPIPLVVGTAEAAAARLQAAMPPLGDLATFRGIATDTLNIVGSGDLAAAKVRIKDLETAWDDAEGVMKPKDRAAWITIDKAIDAALNALRADAPKQAQCTEALRQLIAKIDGVTKA